MVALVAAAAAVSAWVKPAHRAAAFEAADSLLGARYATLASEVVYEVRMAALRALYYANAAAALAAVGHTAAALPAGAVAAVGALVRPGDKGARR